MLLKVISLLFALHIISIESYPFGFPLESNETNIAALANRTGKVLDYRLPPFIEPENYKIVLTPYLDEQPGREFTFDGEVKITLQIKKKAPKIALHSRELNFSNKQVSLRRTINNEVIDTLLESDPERDFKYIKPLSSAEFLEGKYVLSINYTGIVNNVGNGFHRSSYENDKGERIWLAATQFEPVGARRAFPSFDEPELKATFDITMRHQKKHYALSNMPVKTSKPIGSIVETTFETTPTMSTYLVAFAVSDFKESHEHTNFRVHARPNAIQHGKLAVETGEKLLHALEDFTGIKFEISKMDQIAVPGKGGAMENWGLVTYGENSLLYDEKTINTLGKQNIVETIAHEFAHQWFGDLVTPKWWKFLWLKEGFASFFQNYITEKVLPEWQPIYQSVVMAIQTIAFDLDSSARTHPIDQDVGSPAEIQSIYDSISYQKGGAIIRMMQHFIGSATFKRGLNIYLHENEFDATESKDLFQALDKAVIEHNINLEHKLATIMDSWVNCKGYPVVTVTRSYNNPDVLQLKQERFVSYNATEEEVKRCRWYVPINYASETNPSFENSSSTSWLLEASKNLNTKVKPQEWVILNKQQTGFYRVNYDEKNWQLIINHLNSNKGLEIHVLNRAQLLNDALAFAKQGILKPLVLLRLTTYLNKETDYVAWVPAFKAYQWLKSKLISTEYYPFFKEHILNTTRKLVKSVGYEESTEDGHIDKLKRVQAIPWACSHGDSRCPDVMEKKVEQWLNEPEGASISPDYRDIALCQGLRTASFNLWKKVFNKCLNSKNTADRFRLMSALSCSNNKEILQYYLNYTVEENSLLNDTYAIILSVQGGSDIGVDTTLEFVIKRFITLLLKYKDPDVIRSFFTSIGSSITAKHQLQKLKATKDIDIPESITSAAISAAEKNLQWLEQHEQEVVTWIKEVKAKKGSH